jgi:hypothetical protein
MPALASRWTATKPHMGAIGVVTTPQVPVHFAAKLGKGVALCLHALRPLKTPAMHQSGLADADGKQGYREEDIVVLMGFLHVKKGNQLQDIWTYFQSLRGKSIDVCRRQLMAQMTCWAHN